MSALVANRCRNHRERKAVAQCPSCQRDFCQECITEHRGRLICGTCLVETQQASEPQQTKKWGKTAVSWGLATISLAFLFMFFYLLGRVLAAIPQSFHENMVF